MATSPTPAKTVQQRPAWFSTLLGSFEAAEAHIFALYNGVDDYVRPGLPVRDYLFRTLRGPFETIVGYSIDQGFTFAEPSMRAVFEQRLGVVQQEGSEQPAPGNDPPLSVAPLDALWMLLRFLRVSPPQSACVIVERFELIAPAASLDQAADPRLALLGLLKDAGTDAALDTRGNPLILLASSLEGVNAYVRDGSSGIMAIEVPLPDYDARLAFISQRLSDEDDVALDGIEPAQLAALTAGLYRRHIENVFLRARSRGGKLTRDLARQVQKELMDLEYSEIMQRVETMLTLEDVGGHVEAKRYFEQRVVKPMRDGKTQRVPSNVLLAGPPGTGKTLLASAVANDSGLNCLYVDLAKLLGGIVGQTEQNFAKFKRGVLANAPCILILDEVDQKVRRGEGGADGGGGGAVENRLFSAVLEFFGDPTNKGRIMGLFLSNRPKLLDPAFMSRMQAIIPILPAESDDARADVLGRILRRQGSTLESWQLQALAGRIVDWSGRDLDQTVDEALAIRDLEGMDTLKALEEAIADRRPSTHDVRAQVNDALRACNNLRLLPEKYRRMAEQVSPVQSTPSADDEPGARRQRRSLDIDN